MKKEWNQYDPGSLYDELIAAVHQPREASYKLVEYLRHLTVISNLPKSTYS